MGGGHELSKLQLVEQTLFTAVPLVFAVLHLLLFFFTRRRKENLYFAVLTTAFSVAAYCEPLLTVLPAASPVVGLHRTAVLLLVVTGWRLSYALYESPLPRRYWFVFTVAAMGALTGWVEPDYWTVILAIAIASTCLLLPGPRSRDGASQRRRQGEGRWILRIGLLALLAGGMGDIAVDVGLMPTVGVDNPWLYGGLVLLVAMSVYLAQGMALTTLRLEKKLVEVRELSQRMLSQERQARDREIERRLLEADNRRKTEELAEARELQLGMLPRALPVGGDFDVAASMLTATEVGGDYYDFDLDDTGMLTVAVGDAVGHGARAGALVAATKSLFATASRSPDLAAALQRFDKAIRKLAIDRVFVALLLARLDRGRLQIAVAGMPPPLHYQAASGRVVEIAAHGAPLGTPMPATYTSHTVELAPGDVVLFMSDGLAELPDAAGEELGYAGAAACFERVGDGSAQSIVDALSHAVRERTGGQPPPDDATFVVLRYVPPGQEEGASPQNRG